MSSRFLGVDAGGTSTRAIFADGTGKVLGWGQADGANAWSSSGPASSAGASAGSDGVSAAQAAADAIVAAISAALGGHDPAAVRGGCIAAAGAISSVPEYAAIVVDGWQALGLPGTPRIVIDVVATYASATALPRGLVLTAGTGAIAAFIADGELERRAGGRGWLVGDEGSAVWLGIEAVRAALLSLDGRGPETRLVDMVASELGVATATGADVPTQITDTVYRAAPAALGRLAPLVVGSAEAGDRVAARLVKDAARCLVETATAAAGGEPPEIIVLGGSVLTDARPIGERVRDELHLRWPDARITSSSSGEAGAVALAMRQAALPVDRSILDRLRTGAGPPS